MQLIYRGNLYDYTPQASEPAYGPRAVNWRYRGSGEVGGDTDVSVSVHHAPRAVNWRYQPRH